MTVATPAIAFIRSGARGWLLILALAIAAVVAPITKARAEDRCAGLARLSSDDFRVTDAELVPAGPAPAFKYDPALTLPEHCRVRGSFGERKGVDGRLYEIRFELRLPSQWNNRFLFEGGADMDGVDWPAYGTLFGRLSPSALQRGFAVVRTNSGHSSPGDDDTDGTWALDQQARVDYAFHALDLTARKAKEIIAAYYGGPAAFSYFVGCSNGGRQAMLVTQRFPTYFDGVVAGSPAFDITTVIPRLVWSWQRLLQIAPPDREGRPILSKSFSDADLKLVTRNALKACDSQDGLADGVISDPGRCRFDPSVLTCKGPKTATCLTPAQVAALAAVMEGPKDRTGKSLYAPLDYDMGFGEGFRSTFFGMAPTLGLTTLRYHSLTPPQPDFDPKRMDLARTMSQVQETAALNDAVSTFMNTFASHGKLIIYNGGHDYGLPSRALEDWYDRLAHDTGGVTDTWARLFVVPGMNHCDGGSGATIFDPLAAIQDWVEHGRAPDQILATTQDQSHQQPICPYPTAAHYDGGDPRKAASFSCRAHRALAAR